MWLLMNLSMSGCELRFLNDLVLGLTLELDSV
jgi:hypothetical protein